MTHKTTRKVRTLSERIADAEARSAMALASGNAALERGDKDVAERHYERAEKWLWKANELRGWA